MDSPLEELAAVRGELRAAWERNDSVHHILVTASAPLGLVVELVMTEEKRIQYGAGPHQTEMVMHPQTWSTILAKTRGTEVGLPMEPGQVTRLLGIPVFTE